MKLHNRQINGDFWSDPDLIYELTREQRMFFIGVTQLAEDSGCLEYDLRSMKILLYPADNDITPDILKEWVEKLVKMEKLIAYEVEGKRYLFVKNFHKHQSLKFMARPEVPLPPWVRWQQKDERERYGKYEVFNDIINGYTNGSQVTHFEDINNDINAHMCEVKDNAYGHMCEVKDNAYAHKTKEEKIREEKISKDNNKTYVSEFEEFWKIYPRKTDKKQAYIQWKARIKSGVSPGNLLLAAKNYALECQQLKKEERYIKHAKTFIGVNGSFEEYINKVPLVVLTLGDLTIPEGD